MRKLLSMLKAAALAIYRFFKKNAFFIISVMILFVSYVLLFTKYIGSVERVFSSLWDFCASVAAYFVFLFAPHLKKEYGSVPAFESGVAEIPDVDLQKYIFFDIEDLIRKFQTLNEALFNKAVFVDYNYFLFEAAYKLCYILLLLIPCALMLFVLVKQLALSKNDLDPGVISIPYKLYCKTLEKVVYPFFRWLKQLGVYFWKNKFFRYYFCSLWAVSLNVVTICAGAVAYYFYFVSCFDITTIFTQIVKLFIDLVIMFWGLPFVLWLAAGIAVFCCILVKLGYKKLRHMEAKNCGFLKTTDYLTLIKGPPGAGKTTLATDFALSWVNIDKTDALEIMMAMEMLFPAFSFQSLRRALNEGIATREVFCIPACDIFVDKLLVEAPAPYLYNTKIYATERNTGTSHVTLETAIKTYSKAYFIYSNDNSVMANYPIRFDGYFDNSEHLKKWDGDFFERNAITVKEKSRYAKILMQDILRMGKKKDYSNPFIGSFGYGIYVNTEWGKSRGNQLTTQDVKKSDEECNQKNDLYSYSLKMCRHACSTVWHRVFFRFIGDEQRPESLSADQRQLCSILEIVDKSELKLALPFGKTLDKIYTSVYEPFKDFYIDYLNCRSDVILSVMLYKQVVALFSRFYSYLYNTFGYYELELGMEKGSEYGEATSVRKLHKYYLMCKKVYADRYNTDCHSGYFTKMQLEAELGILDYPSYAGRKMTPEEMIEQRDYFIEDMMDKMNMAEEYLARTQPVTTKKEESFEEDIIEL